MVVPKMPSRGQGGGAEQDTGSLSTKATLCWELPAWRPHLLDLPAEATLISCPPGTGADLPMDTGPSSRP